MRVKFANPIIFPADIKVSKHFYAEIIGLKILQDTEPFILFEGDFGIHADSKAFWASIFTESTKGAPELPFNNNLLLYFQTDYLDETFAKLKDKVNLIHPIKQEPWGERIFRFFDPDSYMIEIGELS